MAKRDYYEVLGVAKGADAKTIKEAYRNLAKEYHHHNLVFSDLLYYLLV